MLQSVCWYTSTKKRGLELKSSLSESYQVHICHILAFPLLRCGGNNNKKRDLTHLTHLVQSLSFTLASDQLLNTFLTQREDCGSILHHLDSRYIMKRSSSNGQYEQEESLQQEKTCFCVD